MRKLLLTGLLISLLIGGVLFAASTLSGPAGDPFDRSILRSRITSMSLAAGDTTVAITVDKSAFPLIRVYADVFDEYDLPVPGLQETDFTVMQDAEPVDFQMSPVSEFGCPTSICLVIDVSLSMAGEPIEAARDAAHQFVDRMGPYDRAAIVAFADCVEIEAPFTDDRAVLHAAIDGLQPVGLTASFDGIYQGVALTAGEPGDRAVIAFSDGCDNNSYDCSLPPDGWANGYADDSALISDLANNAAVSVYTLTFGPIESTCLDPMEAFAAGTGGNYRHSPDASAIDSVYAEIQEAVCNRYLFVYRSTDTTPDFSNHSVTVCFTGNGSFYCDSMSYREPAAPQITLTSATIALSEECQPVMGDLVIEAYVTDLAPPELETVQLLYRGTTGTPAAYQALAMTPSGVDDIHRATISGSQWTAATIGVEYFISASDGDATVTLPAADPYQTPLVISFCPNRPPTIVEVDVACTTGTTLEITAVIRDTLNYVERAAAFFRPIGAVLYDSTTLVAVGGDTFTATLSPVLDNVNYELLIRAWDDFGLAGAVGPWPFRCDSTPNDNPHPTDRWITLLCEAPYFAGQILQPGDVIRAYDPGGTLSGKAEVAADSTFPELLVYADNPGTPLLDEGAEAGDLIWFTLNDYEVALDADVFWTAHGDTIEVCGSLPCQEFNLQAGWRLISFNREFSAGVDSLVALLGGPACVEAIMSFDRGAQSYAPDLAAFSTLHMVDFRHAYLVYLTCNVQFGVCDPVVSEMESIPIRAGWNLVPYWPSEILPVEKAWESVLAIARVGIGYDGVRRVWLPENPSWTTLAELAPNQGYWLLASGGGQLVYPGWSSPAGLASEPVLTGDPWPGGIAPSREWISVYGEQLTLDRTALADGATVSIVTARGQICGLGTVRDGRLRFAPVYGNDGSGEAAGYPERGDTLYVAVDGRPVYPPLVWSRHGDHISLPALSTSPEIPGALPMAYGLAQNYPNPFNPQTTIAFELPNPGHVTLTIYNILGQMTARVADGWYPAGSHRVTWNGRDQQGEQAGTGLYLYRLETEHGEFSRKMLLLK